MKKCPNCGTVTTDDRQTCGLCGTSLAGTVSLSLEQAEQIPAPEFHIKTGSRKSSFIGILVGLGLLVVGLVVLAFTGPSNPVGFAPLLIGMFATAVGITSLGNVRPRGWRGRQAKTGPILPTGGRAQGETDREEPK